MQQTTLSYTVTLDLSFEQAIEKIKDSLKEEGFGVLTEIDVKETLKKKLDADFRKYVILGACNPKLAHESLSNDLNIGLLLPCNVIVYENEAGKIVVSAVDPNALMNLSENKELLCDIASQASEKIHRSIEKLERLT